MIRFDSPSIIRASPSKTFSNRLFRNPEQRTHLEKSARDDGEHKGIGNNGVGTTAQSVRASSRRGFELQQPLTFLISILGTRFHRPGPSGDVIPTATTAVPV